jgi:hypothetical protein
LSEFFFRFFSFSLFSKLVTCVCCQCTHQRGDWGPEHPRTGGWSLLAVMSDWQRGVDWLLAEYCRQVAAWFALVQLKSGRKRSIPCGAFEEWRDK